MKTLSDVFQGISKSIKKKPPRNEWTATIISEGTKPWRTLVQFDDGRQIEVYNNRMATIPQLKVIVGQDPTMPNQLNILRPNDAERSWNYWVVNHHESHEYPNHDTVWVQGAQFLPFNALPAGAFTVTVYGGAMNGDGEIVDAVTETVNLAASVPTAGARYVLIEFDETGAVVTTNGATVDDFYLLTRADIPALTDGRLVVAAVALYDGQDEIKRDARYGKRNDFVDLRWANWIRAHAGGAGDVVGPASATDNAISRFDTTTGKLIQSSAVAIDDAGRIIQNINSDNNIALGEGALGSVVNDSGLGNVAVGRNALGSITGGYNNVAVGHQALDSAVVDSESVGIGSLAGQAGSLNQTVAIGYQAGQGKVLTDSILIGAGANIGVGSTGTNRVAIGKDAVVEDDNTTVMGNAATVRTLIRGNADLDSGKTYNINSTPHAHTAAETVAIPESGWIACSETWTRTGNYTFTVSGDVTAKFRKGAKIRYKDGGAFEYGVVGSSSYGAPNTTVTLFTNDDYAMAAATITDSWISYVENPEGFPRIFAYTPSTTNFTLGNGTVSGKFSVLGNRVIGHLTILLGSTSSVTGAVTASLPGGTVSEGGNVPIGVVSFVEVGTGQFAGVAVPVSNTAQFKRFLVSGTAIQQANIGATTPFTWGDTDYFTLSFSYGF